MSITELTELKPFDRLYQLGHYELFSCVLWQKEIVLGYFRYHHMIEYFRLNIEYLWNAVDLKKDRT